MKNSSADTLIDPDELELEHASKSCARPFIKWVGGKTQLLPQLVRRLPKKFGHYYEPFIGGGALFFSLQPRRAVVGDINPELVNAYHVVQNDVESLIEDMGRHVYDKDYYYQIRGADRTDAYSSWSSVQKASRLIYLNKSCYNGLYRVNSRGEFNTPFGRYTNPTIIDADNLRECSRALQGCKIICAPFHEVASLAQKEDFIYFDPPYVPLSTTADFTGYSKEGFDESMQDELYELCERLHAQGAYFMLSNSSAPYVLDRYKSFSVERVPALRAINSKAHKRGAVDEVIITNYR